MMDEGKSDIIAKMKALRAKIGDKAATESEVEAAARMFAKLSVQHDIDESMLKEAGTEKGFLAIWGAYKKKLPDVVNYVWEAIQELTETRLWNSDGQLHIAGRRADVEMAMYIVEISVAAAKRGWFKYSAPHMGEGQKALNAMRYGFNRGFGSGLRSKLISAATEKKQYREEKMGGEGSTALVVVKNALANEVLERLGVTIGESKKKAASSVNMDYDAYVAGREHSSTVNVRRPLEGAK